MVKIHQDIFTVTVSKVWQNFHILVNCSFKKFWSMYLSIKRGKVKPSWALWTDFLKNQRTCKGDIRVFTSFVTLFSRLYNTQQVAGQLLTARALWNGQQNGLGWWWLCHFSFIFGKEPTHIKVETKGQLAHSFNVHASTGRWHISW